MNGFEKPHVLHAFNVLLIQTFHIAYFKQVMPKKPKAHRIHTLTTAAFDGWTIIRDAVLQQFGPTCKDSEYMLLLHLLDEVLPLVFYFYCTVFRGGDFHEWLTTTFRMALVFVTFKRKNYDKATLCQLSDILYHATENKPLVDNIKAYLIAFTEKKVEVFHSVLRRFVKNETLSLSKCLKRILAANV